MPDQTSAWDNGDAHDVMHRRSAAPASSGAAEFADQQKPGSVERVIHS
jgi:hypothetical protein